MEKFKQPPKQRRDIEQDRLGFNEAIKNIEIGEIDTEFDEQSVKSLTSELGDAKLLLLGETHGVKENPHIIYTLFKKFGFKKLALEWNKKWGELAEKFLQTEELVFEAIEDSSDGRITAGHFALIKKLKNEGLLDALVCFDEDFPSDEWDARDASMAKKILASISDSATLVVAGNLHTEIMPITFDDGGEHHPMGENIKKQIPALPSGKIKYLTGQFYNFGTREFGPKPDGVQLPKAKFYKSSEGLYYFELPEAHPAVVPNPSETL